MTLMMTLSNAIAVSRYEGTVGVDVTDAHVDMSAADAIYALGATVVVEMPGDRSFRFRMESTADAQDGARKLTQRVALGAP